MHYLIWSLLAPFEEGIIYDAHYLLPYFTDMEGQLSEVK